MARVPSPLLLLLFFVLAAASSTSHAKGIDNVAVQWNSLLTSIICADAVIYLDANTYYSQLHLAQWHALLALRDTGSSSVTEEAVVAYASHAILTNYLPLAQDVYLDPLLESQLKALTSLRTSQKKLAKRLGEAVALRLVISRVGDPGRQFAKEATREALDAYQAPGLYRYLETPTSNYFSHLPLVRTYVVPNPNLFKEAYLKDYKPPAVPSSAWDKEYNDLKDIGRADWAGRTTEMDNTASFWFGAPKKGSLCTQTTFWASAAIELLPASTPLLETVVLFAKMHVAIHDATVVGANLQWGYWFWRPISAYRLGDAHHKPDPAWTPWTPYNLHPEYPSLTTSIAGAGAEVLNTFFKKQNKKMSSFTVEGGTAGDACNASDPGIGPRHYASVDAAVRDAQLGRMYAGHHFNTSVTHGAELGAKVADFVEKFWTEAPNSGVIPDATYLNVVAQLPHEAGDYSPVKLQL